ncbi:MAG: hypothetical protein ACI8ZM_000134 [Crocinitomix sp.]|jgi:hypothetical protein
MKLITILSLLVLLFSNETLLAAETEQFYTADFTDSNEEHIMMDYSSVYVPSKDKTYYECMVWNTKTGQSKLYFYDYTDKVFKAYETNVQIPSDPLPNCGNDGPSYHMDYSAVHVPSQDKTYYECVVWDSETGESILYFYSYDNKTFQAYGDNVQLPKNPLPEVGDTRNVRMNYTSVYVPTEDKTYYECMVWDTQTGMSKLYFYSYTDKVFKAYGDNIQFPANPLPNNSNNNPSIFMDYSSVYVSSKDKTYYECLVWDEETGNSLLYFYDYTEKKFKAYGDNVQMPSNPLGEQAAKDQSIFMDYTSVHVPSEDKTYYECMIWDTQTGVSKLYFYSYTDKVFKAYEDNVQLPAKPLSNQSESFIMMDYTSIHVSTQDKTYYECMVWNPNTGESKLYNYNYTSKSFVAYGQNVQLPAAPLD